MREIIEDSGRIGGGFEMPYAAGARLITTQATAAGERGDPSGACGSPRILTDPYEFGLVAAGKSDLGRLRPRSVSGAEIGRRFDIEVPRPYSLQSKRA
jgi:hypothetical protein